MKTILFLCTGNSCRSQMAEGWTRKLWPQLQVHSAGSAPAREVDYLAVQAMAEKGIMISTYLPKSLLDLPPSILIWSLRSAETRRKIALIFPVEQKLSITDLTIRQDWRKTPKPRKRL